MTTTDVNDKAQEPQNEQTGQKPPAESSPPAGAEETSAEGSIFTADVAKRVISTDQSITPEAVTDAELKDKASAGPANAAGDLVNNTGADAGGPQGDADAATG